MKYYKLEPHIINELFASRDMRKYLIENAFDFSEQAICDLIYSAPIDYMRKAELLTKFTWTIKSCITQANSINKILQDIKLNERELFILCSYCNENNSEVQFETFPFYSYEKALEYINSEEYDDDHTTCWHRLEKWIPDNNGNLTETISYEIIHGKLCYHPYQEPSYFVPTPFKAGDIIAVDCRPFYPVKHLVVIEAGDNRDCCYPSAIYLNADGTLASGAVKHNHIFGGASVSCPIPALYSAELFTGTLPENEAILTKISHWINGIEARGRALWEFIYKTELTDRTDRIKPEMVLDFLKLKTLINPIRKEDNHD